MTFIDSPKNAPQPFEIMVSSGLWGHLEVAQVFGRNSDIDSGGNEDIWEGGGFYTGFPLGDAELVTVSSTSGDDDGAGDGARTVRISGLDANGLRASEVLTLDGTNLVDSENTYLRLNTIEVLTSGSNNQATNAGIISCAHKVTTANIFIKLPIGSNRSFVCAYTIPADATGYFMQYHVDVHKSQTSAITGAVWFRPNGGSPCFVRPYTASNTNSHADAPWGGIKFEPLTDVAIRVEACTANNTTVTANFDIVLINN